MNKGISNGLSLGFRLIGMVIVAAFIQWYFGATRNVAGSFAFIICFFPKLLFSTIGVAGTLGKNILGFIGSVLKTIITALGKLFKK